MGSRIPHKALIFLFLFCVCIRILWVVHRVQDDPNKAVLPDSPSYIRPALAMLYDHRFSIRPGSFRPEFFRTPGYPFFLTSVFAVFGENLLAVCIIQAVISAGTVIVVYFIGERVWSQRTGWIAAALVMLEPLQTIYTATILTETLYTFILAVMAFLGVCILQKDRNPIFRYFALGSAIAIAILIRPGTYYFAAVIFILLLVDFRKKRSEWQPALFAIVAFLGPLIVLVGGWKLRNHYSVDSWRLTNLDSRSLYLTRAAGIVSEIEGITIKDARAQLLAKLGRKSRNESEGDYYERMREEGLKIIKKHPDKLIPMTLDGMKEFLGGVRYILAWLRLDTNVFTTGLATIILGLFYLFVVSGIIISFRMGQNLQHIVLLSIPLYVALISITSPVAFVRYRAPVTPILCLYAAAGAIYLYQKWSKADLVGLRLKGRERDHKSGPYAISFTI